MIRIAHIVNPFHADKLSDLFTAQPITFQSMLHAKKVADQVAAIELLTAQFAEDRAMVPGGFRPTKDLDKSVLDRAKFSKTLKLPLIADILQRVYNESNAEYLIYTNVDIGLYPGFYKRVVELISAGHDAIIINRRRLSPEFTSVSQLPDIYNSHGKKHPGFDCFVFHRNLFPKMKLEGICIGVPFIEISFSQNLFALANNFKLVDDERLTFHIGMEIFKHRAPREYFFYNRKQFHRIETELLPQMSLEKFPYYKKPLLVTFFKWAWHPCIPVRLVFKLWWRQLFAG